MRLRPRFQGRSTALTAAVLGIALLDLSCTHPLATATQRAIAAWGMGDFETSAAEAEQARFLLEHEAPDDLSSLCALIELQGRASRELGRSNEALSYFTEMLSCIERAHGANHPALVVPLAEMGEILEAADRPDEAREIWERAVALDESADMGARGPRAFAFAGLARLAWDEGDRREADRLFREAITSGNTTERRYWPIRSDYADLLREIGDDDGAARVEAPVGARRWTPHPTNYLWNVLLRRSTLSSRYKVAQRWPDASMPLRVYLPTPPAGVYEDPDEAIRVVENAAVAWTDVVRPGIPSFVFVSARSEADLPIRWIDDLKRNGAVGETAVRRWRRDLRVKTIELATHWMGVPVKLDVLAIVARHELGHALGLLGHSPDPEDLMYWQYRRTLAVAAPTERDRATLRLLYGFEPGQVLGLREIP